MYLKVGFIEAHCLLIPISPLFDIHITIIVYYIYYRSTLLDSDVRVDVIIRWDPSAFINNRKG